MALCQWLSGLKINSHIRTNSCVWVCANSRARYQVLFSTAGTLRREIDDPAKHRLVPRLPKKQSTQRECTASKTTPSDSYALLCLSVAVAGPLGKPLSPAASTQHPLSQLSSPLPIVACQHRSDPSLRGSISSRPFATACVSRCCCCCCVATGGTGCFVG